MRRKIGLLLGIAFALALSACGEENASSSISSDSSEYKITWQNYDGEVLDVNYVERGEFPRYQGDEPTRPDDERYSYAFSGWTPKIQSAYGDATYKATYDSKVREYTITWEDYDGTVLKEDLLAYGETPSYGQDPERTGDEQYSYAFSGWVPEITSVKGNQTYVANYESETNKYNVTWEDYDGTVLLEEEWDYGSTPVYEGEKPKREGNAQYSYTFTGWESLDEGPLKKDRVYVAEYNSTTNEYQITWQDYNGDVLRVDSVAYGDKPRYGANPKRKGDAQYSYAFSNWEPSVEKVTGDATYKAVYTNTTNQYAITWKNYDGTTLRVDSVPYGETPSYGGVPENDEYAGPYDCYVFDGWYPEVVPASSDSTYTATYSKQACTEFTIRFDANGGAGAPRTEKKEKGWALRLSFVEPSREGYLFYGWNNLYDGKVYQGGDWLTADINLTMYAMWAPACSICGGDGYLEDNACQKCEGEGYFCPYCNEPLVERLDWSLYNYVYYDYGYCSRCGKKVWEKREMPSYGTSKIVLDEKVMCTNCQGTGYVGTIGECDKYEREAAPTVSENGARSITLKKKPGYEYSIDGGEYQSSNVFDGLLPHTTYTFRQRRATSGGVPFGVESKEVTVTTTDASSYYVTYELDGGENNAKNLATYLRSASSTPLYAPTKKGYNFAGWSYNGEIVSEIKGSWNVDIVLEATWTLATYRITYDLDGGTASSSYPDEYTIQSESICLPSPHKDGYTFGGWFSDPSYSNEIDGIPTGSAGDMTIYAKWNANKNNLFVDSSDESKGCVSVSGAGYSGEEITVTAIPTEGYALKGWYHEGTLASRDNPYSFDMPAEDYTLTAEFWTEAEGKAEKESREALGIDPVFDTKNKTVTYGLYPQTHVKDSDIIDKLNGLTAAEANGWYLLDGSYYAKTSARPYSSTYVFDDGTTIVRGTEYWFKCEPIKWKILSSDNGEYSLVSTILLDAHRYNASWDGKDSDGYYANNYERSEIRAWLNDDFYNSAFYLDNSLIQTTEVDNSHSSVGAGKSNTYSCSDTSDNVYLLTYPDYGNASYFADNEARRCKTTDWARANRVDCRADSSYPYNGWYWTRSPINGALKDIRCVTEEGKNGYGTGEVSNCNVAVRPAVTIKIA